MASPRPPSYVKRNKTPAIGASTTGDRALDQNVQNIHERIEALESGDVTAQLTTIRTRLENLEGSSGGGSGDGTADAVVYRGDWDASTGDFPSSDPSKGDYYVVATAGTTDLNGIADWEVGDWAVYNGNEWDIVRNRSIEAGDNITVTTEDGVTTIAAAAGQAPYYIPEGETYTVAQYAQVPYVLDITNDGTLVLDGALINVPTSAQADDLPIATITTSTTLNADYYTVLVDATSGDINVELPTPSSVNQRVFNVKRKDSSINMVTVVGTVDGVVNPTLPLQYDSISVQSDGSTYWLL